LERERYRIGTLVDYLWHELMDGGRDDLAEALCVLEEEVYLMMERVQVAESSLSSGRYCRIFHPRRGSLLGSRSD